MSKEVYANVATNAYARLTDPGPYAQRGPGKSEAARANANAMHKEGSSIYNVDEIVDVTLK